MDRLTDTELETLAELVEQETRFYQRFYEAIESGKITEEEARQVYFGGETLKLKNE